MVALSSDHSLPKPDDFNAFAPMTDPHTPSHPPLAADDPRISEWLDGRLAPADAAGVEKAVQRSPELVALVADLRMIRGALREMPTDSVPVGLSDSIMAAIASARPTSSLPLPEGEGMRAVALAGETSGSTAHQRRMPWMAMVGALAAGILATVVINLPREDGREVAIAPAPRMEADTKKGREGETTFSSRGENRGLAAAKGKAGEELAALKDESSIDTALGVEREPGAGQFADARRGGGGFDAERDADELKTLDAPAESLAKSYDMAKPGDESIGRGRQYRMKESEGIPPQAAGAPPSPAAPLLADIEEPRFVAPAPAEPSFVPPVPATEAPARDLAGASVGKRSRAGVDALRQENGLAERAEQPSLRRAAALPAGVVVITVGRPSERRALDHLVAASGLEVTREPDRLELIGDQLAIDAFLITLEEAGLVPRGAAPRKKKADKQGGRELRSLALRIVDRNAKQGAAAESERKP